MFQVLVLYLNTIAINDGAPQGIILGPRLFLICINDVKWFFLFADDAIVINFNTYYTQTTWIKKLK